jgi:gliding motility-associated-like protein
VFNPAGPSVDASGNITGFACGETYTVLANNGSCDSAVATFVVDCQLPTPAMPSIITVAASCSASGSALISNFASGVAYTFTPSGPSVDASGNITGFVCGTSYTVTATLTTCESAASMSFTVGCILSTPATPTVVTTASTCSANGTATILNYSGANTYVFNPAGPSVDASGNITGFNCGDSYTVLANNGSCSSAVATFSVGCQLDATNSPTIAYTAATCFEQEIATISSFDAALTYTFTPSGPTIGTGGLIIGLDCNTSYSLTASNGSCPSLPVTIEVDCIVTNACQIPQGISPNGDQLNDVWDIEFLDAKRVEIFNRYGMIVYDKDNYRKEFGGISNDGQTLADGTYFWIIYFEDKESKAGWLYINRENR